MVLITNELSLAYRKHGKWILWATLIGSLFAYLPSMAHGQGSSLSGCVSIDRESNSLGDFFVNSCNVPLNVSFVDEGYCKNGCSLYIPASGRSSTNKHQGYLVWAACPYPQLVNHDWRGGRSEQYKCR